MPRAGTSKTYYGWSVCMAFVAMLFLSGCQSGSSQYTENWTPISAELSRLDFSNFEGNENIEHFAKANAYRYDELHRHIGPETQFEVFLGLLNNDRVWPPTTGEEDYRRMVASWKRWPAIDFELADITERPHPDGSGIYGRIISPEQEQNCMFAILGFNRHEADETARYRGLAYGYHCVPKDALSMEQFITQVEQIRIRNPWYNGEGIAAEGAAEQE